MKKTLVALAVTAFAASASAVTVYDQDGSTVDFYGSIRLLLDNGNTKVKGGEKKEKHTNLHNDGSKFGVNVKHNISDDFYALGSVEFGFKGEKSETDQFGNLNTKLAFVGFGSKEFGELTFGRQKLIGNDIAQADFDYTYAVFKDTLATSSNSAIRYDYKGFENAILSADYRFAEKRDDDDHNVVKNELKSGYDIGAIYNFKLAENQSATVAAGYSHYSYATETNKKDRKDAYQFGAKYTIDALTLAGDYAGSFKKTGDEKERFNGFRLGVSYAVTPEIDVYGNYGYGVKKTKEANVTTEKTTGHKYMLGSAYKLTKNVVTYVEASISKEKEVKGLVTKKTTEKDIGVGLRVEW